MRIKQGIKMNLQQLNELLMEKKSRTFRNLINHTSSLLKSLKEAEMLANGANNGKINQLLSKQIKAYKYHVQIGHMDIEIEDDVVVVITDVRLYSNDNETAERTLTIKLRNGKLFETSIKK